MSQFIEKEREFSRIETGGNGQFLDWKEERDPSTKTSTIIAETRKAYKNYDRRL
jgi:hypothetical protein